MNERHNVTTLKLGLCGSRANETTIGPTRIPLSDLGDYVGPYESRMNYRLIVSPRAELGSVSPTVELSPFTERRYVAMLSYAL
jgi:hypothetical protein